MKELKQMYEEFFEIARKNWSHILNLYKKFEYLKPIMLFDVQEQKIYAYPYIEFKSSFLTEKSQVILEKEYQNSLLKNKVVVFVKDNEKKQLWSHAFDLE
jgi:hypothetical protein